MLLPILMFLWWPAILPAASESAHYAPALGEREVAVVLVNFLDNPGEPGMVDQAYQAMESVDDYFEESSYNQVLPLAGAGPAVAESSGPTSLVLETERYDFHSGSGDTSCLGEDDALRWQAVGSLAPGASFTFTPQVPACYAHPAAVSVIVSWTGGVLELSSVVPDQDYSSWDSDQRGTYVRAPAVLSTAQLCMFPYYGASGRNYTITVTNVGSEPASDIVLNGRSENDWPVYYYARCLNADADADGWNDALEHTMGILTYPNGYVGGLYQPYILWGSNYLRDVPKTLAPDDEVDAYPPDLNDDGVVDVADLAEIQGQIGTGNGIPIERISPNPSDAEYYYKNTLPWRRYDLDGDGWVDATDAAIVEALIGQPVPMLTDLIDPTARLLEPQGGSLVPRGEYLLLKAHAWDNAALTRVDYLVNGRTVCSPTDARPTFGFESPLYSCWWKVPKKVGSYELTVRAYDGSGRVGVSTPVSVLVQ